MLAPALDGPRRAWADRSLRTKGLVIISLPLTILLAALISLAQATMEEERAADLVQITLAIQGDLQRLDALLYRAALRVDFGQARDRSAERLEDVEKEATFLFTRLGGAIKDAEQKQRLNRLEPIVRTVLTGLRTESQGADRAGQLEPMEADLASMRERETELLSARTESAALARDRNLSVTVSAGAFGLLGSLGAILLFSTGVVRRVALIEANAHQLARGEPLGPPPVGADELGRLGVALGQASALLSERNRRLEELVAGLLQVQEDERRRVSYELHDGLAQVAAAAHQHLQAFADRFPPATAEGGAALERGVALVKRTVRETRAAIAGLRPTALDDFGLALALKLELDALAREGRRTAFIDRLSPTRLPPVLETNLFRIAQEAIANVRKHAGASASVELLLEAARDRIILAISDDGGGLAPQPPIRTSGPGEQIGLQVIRERASLVGGIAVIEPGPSGGTLVRVELRAPTKQSGSGPAGGDSVSNPGYPAHAGGAER